MNYLFNWDIWKRKKGDIIQPHLHLKQKREIYDTQEVLYLRKEILQLIFMMKTCFSFIKKEFILNLLFT